MVLIKHNSALVNTKRNGESLPHHIRGNLTAKQMLVQEWLCLVHSPAKDQCIVKGRTNGVLLIILYYFGFVATLFFLEQPQ